MRILILGAGGIGGYFGGRLIEVGADVTFLVRANRERQLRSQGLLIKSPLGDFARPVWAVSSAEDAEPPDIVVITCKAYDLQAALSSLKPIVRPGLAILPLLNGVAHLETIERELPQADVWGGLAHIGVTLDSSGVVQHLNTLNTLMYGGWEAATQGNRDEGHLFVG